MPRQLHLNQKSNRILLDFCQSYQINLFDKSDIYLKLEQGNYQPLVLEKQESRVFSLTHTSIQNGDLMFDPSIEFLIQYKSNSKLEKPNPKDFKLFPIRYINHFVGMDNQCGWLNPQRKMLVKYHSRAMPDCTSFCNMWMQNIKDQEWYLRGRKANPEILINKEINETTAII